MRQTNVSHKIRNFIKKSSHANKSLVRFYKTNQSYIIAFIKMHIFHSIIANISFQIQTYKKKYFKKIFIYHS